MGFAIDDGHRRWLWLVGGKREQSTVLSGRWARVIGVDYLGAALSVVRRRRDDSCGQEDVPYGGGGRGDAVMTETDKICRKKKRKKRQKKRRKKRKRRKREKKKEGREQADWVARRDVKKKRRKKNLAEKHRRQFQQKGCIVLRFVNGKGHARVRCHYIVDAFSRHRDRSPKVSIGAIPQCLLKPSGIGCVLKRVKLCS